VVVTSAFAVVALVFGTPQTMTRGRGAAAFSGRMGACESPLHLAAQALGERFPFGAAALKKCK